MTATMPSETRHRILDAAEELFAEKGIAATSVRVLTQAAGVNLAAVHYHFGSKEGLVDAVLERSARTANDERLADLAQLEASADGEPLAVEDILTAFIVPGVRRLEAQKNRRQLLARLRSRIEAEPPELVEALFRRHFGVVFSRFLEAFQRALPEMSKELVAERFRFTLGSLSFAFSQNFDLDIIPGHQPTQTSHHAKTLRLIDFLAAGLRSADSHRSTLDLPDRDACTLDGETR